MSKSGLHNGSQARQSSYHLEDSGPLQEDSSCTHLDRNFYKLLTSVCAIQLLKELDTEPLFVREYST